MRFQLAIAVLVLTTASSLAQYNVSAPSTSCPVAIGNGLRGFLSLCPDGHRFVVGFRNAADGHLYYSVYDGISNPVVQNVDLGYQGYGRAVAVDANRVAIFAQNYGGSTDGVVTYVDCDNGTHSAPMGSIPSLDYYTWQQKLIYVPSEHKVLIPSWNNAKLYDIVNNTLTATVLGSYAFGMLPNANGNFIAMRQIHPAFGGTMYLGEFHYDGTAVGSEITIGDVSFSPNFVERLDNGNFIIICMKNAGLVIRVYNGATYALVGQLNNALASNGGFPVTYEKLPDGKIVIVMSSEYNQMIVLEADGLSTYAVYPYTVGVDPLIRLDPLGFIQVQTQSATNNTIQLRRIDMSGSYRCNTGADCTCASGVCGLNTCVNQVCGVAFRPSTYLCRASNPLVTCDPEEYCTGSSNECPTDVQTGGASSCEDVDTDPTCSDDGSVGTVFKLKCVFPYNVGRGLVLSAEGLVAGTINSNGRELFPSGQSGCPRPALTATPAGVDTPWSFTYDTETCKYIARLTIAPNDIPTNWHFSNGSNAIHVGSDATYNLVTVPINVATTTLIGATEQSISNHLYSYTLRLPRLQNTSATLYALKMFKLSDNNRGSLIVGQPGEGFAFSAILMGGLTSGPNRHVLNGTPEFIPDPSSPSLTCVVEAEIYVYCGPFYDTNAANPVAITGVLQVTARCLEVDCIPRVLYLPVSFLAGDYESTVDGQWSALAPLIWRRLGNNDAEDVELTNDVIVGGDKLILSVHFDEGTVSTLTKLFITVNGYSGAGSTLVQYSNSVFIIHDTNPSSPVSYGSTIIYNQAHQAEIDSFFRFPVSYDINFAVEWSWPAALPTDYRGQFVVDSFFDIAYDVARRREGSANDNYVLIKAPQGSVGAVDGDGQIVILTSSSSALSFMWVCAVLLATALLL